MDEGAEKWKTNDHAHGEWELEIQEPRRCNCTLSNNHCFASNSEHNSSCQHEVKAHMSTPNHEHSLTDAYDGREHYESFAYTNFVKHYASDDRHETIWECEVAVEQSVGALRHLELGLNLVLERSGVVDAEPHTYYEQNTEHKYNPSVLFFHCLGQWRLFANSHAVKKSGKVLSFLSNHHPASCHHFTGDEVHQSG